MPLGMEVDLRPSHIVLDGDPAPPRKGHSSPSFWPMSIVATVANLNYCCSLVGFWFVCLSVCLCLSVTFVHCGQMVGPR